MGSVRARACRCSGFCNLQAGSEAVDSSPLYGPRNWRQAGAGKVTALSTSKDGQGQLSRKLAPFFCSTLCLLSCRECTVCPLPLLYISLKKMLWLPYQPSTFTPPSQSFTICTGALPCPSPANPLQQTDSEKEERVASQRVLASQSTSCM